MKNQKTDIYVSDYTGDDSIPVFIAFAIEQYKHHKGIPGDKAMEILSDAGALEHLAEFYDVMHQHGTRWLMEELDDIVERNTKDK